MFFDFLGALGLFLLGMWMMTDGLKLAGGRALETLLGTWTSSAPRGLVAGITITALVQSSSAVTIATLGFVNAGIISFQRALWVVFGSNVGTTVNAWIVTFFGFSFKLSSVTFPLIGIGALLRMFCSHERAKALGLALAGFALLFLGIDALKDSFSTHAESFAWMHSIDQSAYNLALSFLLGFVLTVMTQSSGAAIAIILTAVFGEVLSIESAAAAIIGCNVGTSPTAIVVALGSSAPTKRLAWAHVLFNTLTACVALLILPLFWYAVSNLAELFRIHNNPTQVLAFFHTAFNVFGVLLMWPISNLLTKLLMALYKEPDPSLGEIRLESEYLDPSIASIPDLAMRCIYLELKKQITLTSELIFQSTVFDQSVAKANQQRRDRITSGLKQLNTYIELTVKSNLTSAQGNTITQALDVMHHLKNISQLQKYAGKRTAKLLKQSPKYPAPLEIWLNLVNEFNRKAPHEDEVLQKEQLAELKRIYQKTKTDLMQLALEESIPVALTDNALQLVSLSRRFTKQVTRANLKYRHLEQSLNTRNSEQVDSSENEDEDEDDGQ